VGRDDEGKGGPPFAKRKGAKGCTPIPLTRLTEKKTKRLAEEAVTSELPLQPGNREKYRENSDLTSNFAENASFLEYLMDYPR
jgi:hypothetical protein